MNNIKIISYNVRGLNSHIKCANILQELKFLGAEVVFLQETHFLLERNQKVFSRDYPVWFYGDSPTLHAKGVAIGFASGVRFDLHQRMTDPEEGFCS